MICQACRDRRHGKCRGGTWCDCQHKPPAGEPGGDRPGAAEPAEEDRSEPGINWLRQG